MLAWYVAIILEVKECQSFSKVSKKVFPNSSEEMCVIDGGMGCVRDSIQLTASLLLYLLADPIAGVEM